MILKAPGRARSYPAAALAVLGLLACSTARADFSACSSAYVKESLEEQIKLYTLCLTKGQMDAKQLAWAFHNRGVAFYRSGNVDRALADFGKSIHYDPEYGLAYQVRAQIYLNRGQLDLAEADYTASFRKRIYRDREGPYTNRGLIRMARGNCAGALEDFNEALQRNDRMAFSHGAKAWLLSTCADERQRSGTEALKSAQLALSLQDSWKLHDVLAAAYAELGRFEDSTRELKVAQGKLTNDDAHSAWHKGLSERLSLYESGKAYRQQPDDAVAAEWLAASRE